jgi:hypothetical protein
MAFAPPVKEGTFPVVEPIHLALIQPDVVRRRADRGCPLRLRERGTYTLKSFGIEGTYSDARAAIAEHIGGKKDPAFQDSPVPRNW